MDEILTVEEVAAYLKVSKGTVRRWCLKGNLPAFKIGREWRIYKKELERMIRQSTCGPDKAKEQPRALARRRLRNCAFSSNDRHVIENRRQLIDMPAIFELCLFL